MFDRAYYSNRDTCIPIQLLTTNHRK